jgi:regulator of protease activity HflC (stomatin/prohibitin superfamily)
MHFMRAQSLGVKKMFENGMKIVGKFYFKAAPTEYAFHFRNGDVKHEGKGIGFWTNLARDSVVLVPQSEWDDPFHITHRCRDDQTVSVRGKMLYHITDPEAFMAHYNFSVNPVTRHHYTSDVARMVSRLIDNISDSSRKKIRDTSLTELMDEKDDLGDYLKQSVNERVAEWGMTCNWIYVAEISPADPELVAAIEAPYRQTLLMEQDKAEHRRIKDKQELEKGLKLRGIEDMDAVDEMKYKTERARLERGLELAKKQGELETFKAGIANEVERVKIELLNRASPETLLYKGLEAIAGAKSIGSLSITPELISALAGGGK